MSKRIRYKATQSVRLKMRAFIVISTIIGGLMIGCVMFTLQMFENEISMASTDPMVVSNIEVFQDTIPVLKGTCMQKVLGIKIHTRGKAQHLNFSGLEVSARGTSKPASAYAGNARLWYTGNSNFFIPSQQLGSTLAAFDDENFKLNGKQKLLEGDNYFWITFDVNQVAESKTTQIDAECISVQIGTLSHEPSVSAPPGSKRILNNIPYYSIGNGDISSLNSWNSARDGAGKRPSNFNESNATFHIQSGHIMRNDLNACLTYLVVERNGVLLSASGIKSEMVEIHGGGTFIQDKTILNPDNLEILVIKNGGNFIHKNTGHIPGKIKQFESYSNVVLNDFSNLTFSEKIEWGNLIIDTKTTSNTDISTCFKSVRGNLELRATGQENFLYSTADDTINISGDLVITGGRLVLAPVKNKLVLNVANEFILKSGLFTDAFPGKSPKGAVEFYPGSKIYLKSGVFKMTGKNSHILFRDEFVTWKQDTTNMTLPDITIMPGCTLNLSSSTAGVVAENRNFIVSSTAMLDCGTTKLTGKGTFRLEPNATLATGHAEGIHSDIEAGSIQTKIRYYSSGADYIFTGTSSPQKSGIFTTMPVANTVKQFTIKKTNPTGLLILQQNLNVTGRLVKERGTINKNSHKLETGEQITATAAP